MTRSLSFKRRGALLSALMLALPLAFASASAHADQLDTITAAKKIRIAIDLAVPPYGLKDEKLNATGSDVETARLLAKSLGLELEIVPTTARMAA
jgi:polar amino acid transport system substrate-binding protein